MRSFAIYFESKLTPTRYMKVMIPPIEAETPEAAAVKLQERYPANGYDRRPLLVRDLDRDDLVAVELTRIVSPRFTAERIVL